MRPFKIATFVMLFFTLLLGVLYPLFMWGFGQLFFHREAEGSLLLRNGKPIGADWIGQDFASPRYFHPRPSAAGDKGYDAANSSGSNWGPTSQKLLDAVQERARRYREENRLPPQTLLPADAVTASGSGLDPHISVENALLQAPRVASARSLPLEKIKVLIEEMTEGPAWGFLGEERVHVLRLNLALDERG